MSSPNKPKTAMKIMYIQIEKGSFTKKHPNLKYKIFFTMLNKDDIDLQEAPLKLPVYLLKKRFFYSVANSIMISSHKKLKEEVILMLISIFHFLAMLFSVLLSSCQRHRNKKSLMKNLSKKGNF